MDSILPLKNWLDNISACLREGTGRVSLRSDKPLNVSLVIAIDDNEELIELTRSCQEKGLLDSEDVIISEEGLAWNTITPESFQCFDARYGNKLSFSTMRMIHESPESIHALNATFLIGKNYLTGRARTYEYVKEADGPSLQ